jgi:hypothetical protein
MATRKDNLAYANHLSNEYDDSAAVDKARYILAKALEHESKADTSRRLGSHPHASLSNAH